MNNNTIKDLLYKYLIHKPTPDQTKLIDKVSEFLSGNSEEFIFLLKGYAGTGKTSVMAALVKTLSAMRIRNVLLAPTGRAAKVLASYAGVSAFTIHKKIYRQKTVQDGFGLFENAPNLYHDTIFIVDEASMISGNSYEQSHFGSGDLLDDLMYFIKSGKRCKVILVGDNAQLPPVGFSQSPALDENRLSVYGPIVSAELTDVVRQDSESGILFNATKIRKQIETNEIYYPKFKVSDFIDIESIKGSELIEILTESYHKYGRNDTIVLCRSNKRANRYNEGIRSRVFNMEEEIETGDRVMVVKNNYQSLKNIDEIDFIANGDMAGIQRIKKYYERYGLRFADITIKFEDYDLPEIDTKIMLDTLNIETASLSAEKNKQLFYDIAEDYANLTNKKKRINAIKEDPFFNALQIKFAYAVTCHKAQGGQWKCVFLDSPFFKDDEVNYEDLRWFYTAVTRATEKLYLVNFDEKHLI